VKVVLDTNVVLSGVFFGGVPGEVLAAWSRGRFDVVVSAAILTEYRRAGEVLASGKPGLETVWRPVMSWIARHAEVVDADATIEPVSADRDDDVFLACARAGGAGFIVSGDRHLQDVSGWRGISVLSPRRFLAEVLESSTAAG
jgi:uncharacterized protein